MLAAVTVITWLTPDLGATIARFRDQLGFHVDDADASEADAPRAAIRLANGAIELVADRLPGERIASAIRRAPADDRAPRPVHPNGAAGLLAIGWGTVDHQRAASSRAGVRFVFAGLDPLLGSAAWLATELSPRTRPPSSSNPSSGSRTPRRAVPGELLLEPAREGPLAAALARYGEGPVALYVRVLPGRWDDLHTELARRGAVLRGPVPLPLGDAYLVRPERPWGPFLLFVRVPSPDGVPGSARPTGA
jgi:hypothetical protein